MFDGIKVEDVSASADALLSNDRLTFALTIDEQTGEVLSDRRRATDRGITFMLIPRQKGGYRVEINGSIHRYHNDGLHNANDFTLADLLAALDQLVATYGKIHFVRGSTTWSSALMSGCRFRFGKCSTT